MVMGNTAGVFLGTALADLLTQLNKQPGNSKPNIIVMPTAESELLKKFQPISRYSGFVTCGAGTNFFTDYLTPVNVSMPVLFRVQIALSVAGVFSVVYKLGSDISTYSFNAGAALVAGSLYIFDCLVHPNDSINFQSSLAGMANIRIQEITLAV